MPAGDDTTSGAGLGGTGNWDQVTALWFNGSTDIAWTNANNDDAYFTGTTGTVTLTESISAGNLFFTNATGNYDISNATGAEVLTIGGVIDTGGGEHTISTVLADGGSLTKNGAGRLHLSGNNSSLTGPVLINQADVAVENNNALGQTTTNTVVDGAALVFNGGAAGITAFYPNAIINGTGITNSGAIRNLTGVTTYYGQIFLGENNSEIYIDGGGALAYKSSFPLTDNGSNFNLVISGSGIGNFDLGPTSIGGTIVVTGTASCYSYVTTVSPTAWKSTYLGPGTTFYVESANCFGTQPASLMTTNVLVDGATVNSIGTYNMYTTDGITVTTNGGTLNATSGTWTTCNLYSQANGSLTLGGAGSTRPGGAAGTTAGLINLGSGTLIKNGGGDCNLSYANPALETYSNLVVNGGSVTFNYDAANGTTSLGAVPATLNPSNIYLNGGSLHVGHTTTIGSTRGIYVAAGGGTIEDVVSSGGTVTINSPITGPGGMNFPNGHAGVTTAITLAANNTYTGLTTVGASSLVTVGSGGSTGTLGTGNTTDNGTLTFNRTGSYTYGGIINGSGVVNKTASGTVTLTGANTYSGNTTISGGLLVVNNTSGSGTGTGSVAVNSGGTLGGTGVISGAVTVASGGTLALGLNTLTISNNLSVGGVTVSLNKSLTPSNGMAVVTGTLTKAASGSVVVTNLGPALVAGDTFQLFSQPLSGGGTMAITGGGPYVTWNNNLAVNGTISVASVTLPSPQINQVQFSNGNIVFSGTNGTANGTYNVLTSTNLTVPLNQWTNIATNTFSSTGQFSVTNAVNPGTPQQYYILQVP